MDSLLSEYLPILIFIGVAVALAIAIVLASFILARQRPDVEKLSPYECGFDPFGGKGGMVGGLRRLATRRGPALARRGARA